MAATFVALLTLARLEDLKRRQGYAAAVAEIDALRDRIGAEWAGLRHLRSGRGAVEFAFEAGSRAEAERRIGLMLDGLARCGDLVAAAVESLDGEVSEALLRQADGLLQAAEADGRPLLIAAEDLTGDDQRLMADLRRAIGENGLALHYQPKLRARTGDLAGAEALVRWTHPVLGPIPPDHFIPMAERSGDIAALTRWVIDRALADRDRLVAQGLAMPIHVNISAPLLADRAFAEDMLARLAGHTRGIGFEITETALIADPEGTLTRLEELARAGVHLSIDDYGAGFSSMAYLRRLPVRELKIDKMFVAGLTASARDPLLVRSTIDLAHALEMEVTAEGVETAATLALLQVMGCDIVQGFFLSRPLPFAGLSSYAAGSAPARLPRPVTLRERLAQRRGHGQA